VTIQIHEYSSDANTSRTISVQIRRFDRLPLPDYRWWLPWYLTASECISAQWSVDFFPPFFPRQRYDPLYPQPQVNKPLDSCIINRPVCGDQADRADSILNSILSVIWASPYIWRLCQSSVISIWAAQWPTYKGTKDSSAHAVHISCCRGKSPPKLSEIRGNAHHDDERT